jgi:hypothetical protein
MAFENQSIFKLAKEIHEEAKRVLLKRQLGLFRYQELD